MEGMFFSSGTALIRTLVVSVLAYISLVLLCAEKPDLHPSRSGFLPHLVVITSSGNRYNPQGLSRRRSRTSAHSAAHPAPVASPDPGWQ